MIKRYCDRCGSPADGGMGHYIDKKTKTEFWVTTKNHYNMSSEADLCPKCIKEFQMWWVSVGGGWNV